METRDTQHGVSVVIPTYNRSTVVARAVASALAAACPADEVIVVDDGSTDETQAVLRPFEAQIRYFYTKHSGAGHARNVGIDLAMQPLVAFLDSDDEWTPDKLYLQRKVMERFPRAVFSFADAMARVPGGRTAHNLLDLWRYDCRIGFAHAKGLDEELIESRVAFSDIAPLPPERSDFDVYTGDIYLALMEAYSVWTCSIVVRKNAAGASFWFPEDQNIFEEWDCFARLARTGSVAYLDCESAIQHVHRNGRLTDLQDSLQATARIGLVNRVWGSDDLVLLRHSHRYHALLRTLYLQRARFFIKEGRMFDAKQDLQQAGGGPLSYRLLTSLPAPVIRSLIGVRRQLLALSSRGKEAA